MNGKPLVAWAVEQAKAVRRIRRVIVSTDSPAIADAARSYGAEAPFLRPAELATDEAPEWMAWRHALRWLQQEEGHLPEGMVSVPPTSPLRLTADIEKCLDIFCEKNTDAVITTAPSRRHPAFNMVRLRPDGYVELVMPSTSPPSRRQEAVPVQDITTVAYVVRPEFVLEKNSLFEGRVRAVPVPAERAVDIDTKLDFEFTEFLMQTRSVHEKN